MSKDLGAAMNEAKAAFDDATIATPPNPATVKAAGDRYFQLMGAFLKSNRGGEGPGPSGDRDVGHRPVAVGNGIAGGSDGGPGFGGGRPIAGGG